jgi:hypothetical protein
MLKRKPQAFSSWAGKRDAGLSSISGKRAPFSSWAGKRYLSPSLLYIRAGVHRPALNSNPILLTWLKGLSQEIDLENVE